MQQTDGFFTGCRGRELYYQCWLPATAPRAWLLLSHGAGEHSGRYRALARALGERGFALAALDHHGHGHSQGVPGDSACFDDYVEDLDRFCDLLHGRLAGQAVFLVGHSLGGLIAGHFLLRAQSSFVGAVLSAPLVCLDPEPGPLQRCLVRGVAAVAPRLGLTRLDPAGISRDPAVVADYAADPLVFHGRLGARQLAAMFDAMATLRQRAGQIVLPILLLHGDRDRMTSPEGSRLLAAAVGSSDRTLRIYTGLYHEIFNEPERQQVIGDMLAWCEARLPQE